MAVRDLRLLTAILTAMIVIDALWNPVVLLAALATPGTFQAFVTPIATRVDLAASCFKIVTMITFCCWIYTAGRNLIDAGVEDLDFSPASRIWWFAVPIMSLFKPFEGMRELWNASRGIWPHNSGSNFVAGWWALWLLHSFAGVFAALVFGGKGGGTIALWAGGAIGIVLAVFAIRLIHGIADGQRKLGGAQLSEIFA